MAAITAGKMIKSGVDKRKARQEHEKEYNKLMSQEFGMTPTARKFINEPVSASVRQQFIDQLDKSAGTTISALSKGGSRMLGQGANVMESLNRSALDMAQLEQQYRASALGLGAQQEMQGRGAQQSLMAQNVAGLAQREMQAQMEQNQIMQDTIRNLAYMGMNGGFEGMFAKKGGVLDTNTLNQVNQTINTPLELKTTPISSGNTGNTNAGNTGSETTSGVVNSILSTPIGGVLNAIPSNNIGTTQMQETSITDNVDFQNWLSSQNIQVPFGVPQDVFMNKMYEQYLSQFGD